MKKCKSCGKILDKRHKVYCSKRCVKKTYKYGCLVEGCNNKHHAKGYCGKHLHEISKFGFIRKRNIRTPNKIYRKNNLFIMDIYNEKNIKICETIIDENRIDEISEYKWSKGGYGYINTKIKSTRKTFKLHQLVLGAKEGYVIDHKNGNILDNRLKNLRHLKQSKNVCNQKISKINKSGITGVHFDVSRCRWMAYIQADNKRINLGRFTEKDNAISARLIAEEKYFGKEISLSNKINNKEYEKYKRRHS